MSTLQTCELLLTWFLEVPSVYLLIFQLVSFWGFLWTFCEKYLIWNSWHHLVSKSI